MLLSVQDDFSLQHFASEATNYLHVKLANLRPKHPKRITRDYPAAFDLPLAIFEIASAAASNPAGIFITGCDEYTP